MINPRKTIPIRNKISHYKGRYYTHINRHDSIPHSTIDIDTPIALESDFKIYSPEEHINDINVKELFKEYAGIKDKRDGNILLSIIEKDIKNIIKSYNPNLKYNIDYEIDPEEPIPYIVIKLQKRLSVNEDIKFSKYIWKSMREKGHKDFLRKVELVVDYD